MHEQDQSSGNFQLNASPSLIKINANYSLQEPYQEYLDCLTEQHRKSSLAVQHIELSAVPHVYHHVEAQHQEKIASRSQPSSSPLIYQFPEPKQVVCKALQCQFRLAK
jgi:hypothetical protein